jgi:multidrug efflux pump subunit AcrA (membrane-fusion protein)
VEASSQSVDVASGTTRMQLVLDNPSGELLPGGYANVKMSLARDSAPLHVPASALIFNKSGMRVATVGPDDKILFKTVTIARDLGRDIELASGIAADDRIVIAPPDGLNDGDKVRITGGSGTPKNGKPTAETDKKEVKG